MISTHLLLLCVCGNEINLIETSTSCWIIFYYLQTSMRNKKSYSILQTYDNSSKCNFPAFPLMNCARLAKSWSVADRNANRL